MRYRQGLPPRQRDRSWSESWPSISLCAAVQRQPGVGHSLAKCHDAAAQQVDAIRVAHQVVRINPGDLRSSLCNVYLSGADRVLILITPGRAGTDPTEHKQQRRFFQLTAHPLDK